MKSLCLFVLCLFLFVNADPGIRIKAPRIRPRPVHQPNVKPPSHSYPASPGLSGGGKPGGNHAYPSNPGLSGSGQPGGSHGYPASPGLSGSGQPGGSHGYPASPGLSGSGQPGGSHAYPGNNGFSGNRPSYPTNQNVHPSYYQPNHGPPAYSPPAPGYGYPTYGGYALPPVQHQPSSFVGSNTFGAILLGLTAANLLKPSGSTVNNYYYSSPKKTDDPIVKELSECSLTITKEHNTDVSSIPCSVVSSFATKPAQAAVTTNELNCLITMKFKNGTEVKTNMPCSELSKLGDCKAMGMSNELREDKCPLMYTLAHGVDLTVVPLNNEQPTAETTTTEQPNTNSTTTELTTSTTTDATNSTEISTS